MKKFKDSNVKEDMVNYVQNELHDVLNSFLNGGFSHKGFILYPLVKDVSSENKRRMSGIISALKKIDSGKFSSIVNYQDKQLNRFNFASAICQIYNNFAFTGKTLKTLEKKAVKPFNISEYNKEDKDYLKPVEDIKKIYSKCLKKYSLGFYIHGSFATKDYVKGWSDADTLLILKKSAFNKPLNLLEIRDVLYNLRENFYGIDPLQHHGVMIITEFDLNHYPEAFLPVDALKHSKSLGGNDRAMSFNIRDSKEEVMAKLNWVADYFKNLDVGKIKKSYDLKFMLHLMTLFPALYLEAKGKYMYKKFSFDIAEKDFSEEDWKPIKYAENLRNKWKIEGKMPFINYLSKINPLLAYRLNSFYIDMAGGIRNKIDSEIIASGMKTLSKKALQRLK